MSHKIPVVGFVSLGCPKALVDTERIVTELRARGYRIGTSYRDADIVIVNTCGFVNEAVRESLDAITEALAENGRVIVCGCLGGRTEADGSNYVMNHCPKVLGVAGPDAVDEVIAMVEAHLPRPHEPWGDLVPACGVRLTPKHYAYLKISEGCNHHCTFCVIPNLRGTLVSRPAGEVIREARNLVEAGVKELLVISQDTAAYGVDRRYALDLRANPPLRTHLLDLCRGLGELGVWTRLHYVYPYPSVDEIVPLMAEGLILPYLDVPFQHAHPRVLKAMKRPASAEKNLERIAAWRAVCPDITIRSTFIAGFPGETEEQFEDLCNFVKEVRFDRLGCFAYSAEENTVAAKMDGQIDQETKDKRAELVMQIQTGIMAQKQAAKVGQTVRVLCDGVDDESGLYLCRTAADAPEVDGNVCVSSEEPLYPGEFYDVLVDDSDLYDLYGTVAK